MNATRLLATIAVIGLLVGGLSFSHAQTATGSVQIVLKGGGRYTAIANPFNTTNNTLPGLFGRSATGLPNGSQVLKWSPGAADFTTYGRSDWGVGGAGWT